MITASRAPTFLGNPPSYIRIVPDTLANLPAVTFDRIPVPEGSLGGRFESIVPTVASRVTPAHAANMAVITVKAYDYTFAGFHNGYDGPTGQHAQRYCFRGIHFITEEQTISQVTTTGGDGGRWLCSLSGDPTPGGAGSLEPIPNLPDHIMFNQCYLDATTGLYGSGQGRIGRLSVEYFGFFNSWVDGTWAGGDGSAQVQNWEIPSLGFYQMENNRFVAPGTNYWMLGGGSAESWPPQPSIIWRRNDCAVPWSWRQSELNIVDAYRTGIDQGYQQRVEAGGTQLRKTAGWSPSSDANGTFPGGTLPPETYQSFFFQGPQAGCYVIDPTTGVARTIAAYGYSTGAPQDFGGYHFNSYWGYYGPITLTAPWPLADGQQFQAYIQMPSPAVLYNSGVTATSINDGVKAHTTAGSRIVTLDAALPLVSADGSVQITASPARESGPFFYTNDTVNRGDVGHNITTTISGRTIKSNDWGRAINIHNYTPAASAPYCRMRYDPAFGGAHWADLTPIQQAAWNPDSCRRRVEIVAINEARTQLTLASPYFETIDFTFSVVTHDGLYREMFSGGKGAFETKVNDRILVEGNVIDSKIPTTVHPQSNDPPQAMRLTIVGDQVTLHEYTNPYSGITYYTWPAHYQQVVARWNTFGGPDPLLRLGAPPLPYIAITVLTGDMNYNWLGRYIKSIDSPTTATLWPVDPRFQGNDAVGDVTNNVRWAYLQTNSHWSASHNIWRYNICNPMGGEAMGSWLGGGHGESSGQIAPTGPNAVQIHDNLFVFGCGSMYGFYDREGWWFNWPISAAEFGPNQAPVPGQVALNCDNSNSYARIAHNAAVRNYLRSSKPMFAITSDTPIPPGGCHHFEFTDNLVDQWGAFFGSSYEPMTSAVVAPYFGAPFSIARNVLIKSSAPTSVPANVGTFAPDNAGVPTPTTVGFTNYSATYPEILDPANYALQDVTTASTVSIAANGLSATLATGTFPATVVPGQFFHTTTAPTEFKRLTGVESTTVSWTTGAHSEAGQAGKSYAITFKGTATDGTDPGPNITVLKQFTDGVRMAP